MYHTNLSLSSESKSAIATKDAGIVHPPNFCIKNWQNRTHLTVKNMKMK